MANLSRLPHIPEDLIIDILLRLPVKSLLRFASVSLQWHTIIRSPRFIDDHVHRDNNITGRLVYLRGGVYDHDSNVRVDIDDELQLDRTYSCLLFSVGTFEMQELPDLPGPITDICGHCNGIFCVLFLDDSLALWNPATRKFRSLGHCPLRMPYCCSIGFGIDPLTGDIKIVLISNAGYLCRHQVAIYRSRDDSWDLFEEEEEAFLDPDSFVKDNGWINTSLNGFCYWTKVQWMSKKKGILAFDIHNDTFQEIEMPHIHMLDGHTTLDIYHDTLAVLAYEGYGGRTIDIWLMNEPGRWTKHRTVPMPCASFYPVGVWDNNHIFASICDMELTIYDLDSGTTRTLELEITEAITFFFYPCPYKESLVLV